VTEINRNILVVEDEKSIRDIYYKALGKATLDTLGKEPFNLFMAASGEEAIKIVCNLMLEGARIAVGFFDLTMPGRMDGVQTIRCVREMDNQVLCTVVTGYGDHRLAEINALFSPDHLDDWDYLSKPFNVGEILQKARCQISGWNHRRAIERQSNELKAMLKEIEELNRTLESKVQERTLELQAKNNELEELLVKLKEMNSQLLQNEKMVSIGQLAAGVAHEINNPIGFVHSNLGTIETYMKRLSQYTLFVDRVQELTSNGQASRVSEFVEELNRLKKKLKLDFILSDLSKVVAESLEGTERVRRIVQDLKSFSRVDEAQLKLANINEGIKSTLNIVWNELKYKATVTTDFGQLPEIPCHPLQLNQVFLNILVNAAQAIESNGQIGIKTFQDGDWAVVRISDNGCGIPEEHKRKIFEPFFTTKEVGKGTGLGLSISYSIVKKHGGEILVESQVGVGTTFEIRLPISSSPLMELGS